VLAKPFDINKLTETVRQCIEQNDGSPVVPFASETIPIMPDSPLQPAPTVDQGHTVLPIAAEPASEAAAADPLPDSAARLDARK
jgi:hypothetical protein